MEQNKKPKRSPKGSGTYSKLPSGEIRFRSTVNVFVEKKKIASKRISGTGRNMTEARKAFDLASEEFIKIEQKKYRKRDKRYDDKSQFTVYAMNICNLQFENNEIEASSLSRDACVINNRIAPSNIGNMEIYSISYEDIEAFWEDVLRQKNKYGKLLSASEIKKVYYLLKKVFRKAYKGKYGNPYKIVEDDIKEDIKKRKIAEEKLKTGIVYMEEHEYDRLVAFLHTDHGFQYIAIPICEFLVETGLRASEAIALKWENISEANGIIYALILSGETEVHIYKELMTEIRRNKNRSILTRSKNKNIRAIQLRSEAICVLDKLGLQEVLRNRKEELESAKKEEEHIFLNRRNNTFTTSTLGGNIGRIYKSAGLVFDKGKKKGKSIFKNSMHVLRRTFVTRRYNIDKWSLDDIAAYIGDHPDTVRKHYLDVGNRVRFGDKNMRAIDLPE